MDNIEKKDDLTLLKEAHGALLVERNNLLTRLTEIQSLTRLTKAKTTPAPITNKIQVTKQII